MSSTYKGMTYQEAEKFGKKIEEAKTLEELKEVLKEIVGDIYYGTREDE